MDYCDKCKEEISKLEPCFRLSYGFLNDDNSFFEDTSLRVHLDCLSDEVLVSKVLDTLEKH